VVQFRYQVIGITMGAVLAVVLAKLFMSAYPVLKIDQSSVSNIPGAEKWQSAMTLKLVGRPQKHHASQTISHDWVEVGRCIGLLIESCANSSRAGLATNPSRKVLRRAKSQTSDRRRALPNPYASALGGFVELPAVLWYTAWGIAGFSYEAAQKKDGWSGALRPQRGITC